MSKENFKKCPNGHYYLGDFCPYCKSGSVQANGGTQKTEMFIEGGVTSDFVGVSSGDIPTVNTNTSGDKPTIPDDGDGQNGHTRVGINKTKNVATHTCFGDIDGKNDADSDGTFSAGMRTTRQLVGWLVSYSLDAMGVDYKLYEGRNIIGRDNECNLTVPDPMISSRHAVLLYRAGKYSITDSQSSHGTFVNDTDIELEPHYLNDGDIIRMGRTVFKFRTAF